MGTIQTMLGFQIRHDDQHWLFPVQGFASGSLDQDAYAPRFFVDQGLEIMVAQSYSKNLGVALSASTSSAAVKHNHFDGVYQQWEAEPSTFATFSR